MKTEQINQALEQIVLLKNRIHGMNPDSPDKSNLISELNQMETAFDEQFGSQLYEVFLDIHDELCPDNDILSASEYIAQYYEAKGNQYFVDDKQGALVHMDDYPNSETKLVLLPNPLRVELNIDAYNKEEVWSEQGKAHLY